MRSLRARLLATLLLLACAGLVVLAAVTYTEQRSFLDGRLDQEVRSAAPAIEHALQDEGTQAGERAAHGAAEGAPPGSGPANGVPGVEGFFPGAGGPNAGGSGPGGGGPTPNLPQGVFGELREPSGKILHHRFFSFSSTTPAEPALPARVPLGTAFSVGSKGSSGLHYRAYATRAPDGAVVIAAISTREVQQTLSHLLLVEGLVIAGVLALLALGASWAVRLGLRPLDRIGRTASEIAAGELSRRVSPADSRSEVGRLGLALNAMLARLEQAFAERTSSEQRLRRFLADASHELRTPLASIRGYAELFGMGAVSDAADTELAMRRIEEEASRMGTLVEDLLTLARLDQAPAPRRSEVDLAELAADAVADARATAPQRSITLAAGRPVWVSGDRDQLRQVLANLLRNALVHTPRETPIEVSVEPAGAFAMLTVRDHGPGLPSTEEELFERFWRSGRGRGRGKAGAGLGLSISRAIVEAHGGQISAAHADGGGAVFTVRLELAPAPIAARDVGTATPERAVAGEQLAITAPSTPRDAHDTTDPVAGDGARTPASADDETGG